MHRRPPTPPPFPYTTLFRSSPRTTQVRGSLVIRSWRLWQNLAQTVYKLIDGCGLALAARNDEDMLLIQGCCVRSEEHTSELQSHHDLVCRLLLEPKTSRSQS